MTTVNEVRAKFLKYMESKGHVIVPSSSLVPENDATTLFTGSGMQPMVPYLLGQTHPLGKRIADSQKCFRSQDIEDIGDNRHTTFFEMLGNWSFGDYFKDEQIEWMFEFLTENLKLKTENLYVTCFKGNDLLGIPRDDYSANLWKKLFKNKNIDAKVGDNPETDGMKEGEHIFFYGEKKNWWSRSGVPNNMPEGEPGGPDSEMFYDFDADLSKNLHANSKWKNEPCHPNCDCGRFLEIGNNVFMQYKKVAGGFEELPQKNVDHGSGLERYVCAINNDEDIFNVDVFNEAKIIIMNRSTEKISYDSDTINVTDVKNEIRGIDRQTIQYKYRVVLDHIRAVTFLICDGVLPGNKDQNYFVRRLIRRAVMSGRVLMLKDNFTSDVAETFIEVYKGQYKNLLEKKDVILNELEKEESKFRSTLENGIKEFNKMCLRKTTFKNIPEGVTSLITGEDAFNLLQNFGFPIELTKEMAEERGMRYDFADFENYKNEHAERSRTASAGKFKGGLGGDGEIEIKYHTATHLLHQALKNILGDSVQQKGSNITPERLRFDFAYGEKMTDEQKKQVEDLVNQKIKEALPVTREDISYEEAKDRGATGLFTDKYGDKVSIYIIGNGKSKNDSDVFSIEMCGGPHVNNTSELGTFKIAKEEAVSAGIRRLKAVLE